MYRELKETQRDGIGPVLGLILAILLGIVNWFVLPSEIGNMYERRARRSRCVASPGSGTSFP